MGPYDEFPDDIDAIYAAQEGAMADVGSMSDYIDEREQKADLEREADANNLHDREAAGYYDSDDPEFYEHEHFDTREEANAELDARISDPDACKACDQSGNCSDCGGIGDDPEAPPNPCSTCGGDGKCATCEGEGTMRPYS